MTKSYKLICDENWPSVEDQVNESIENGYRPVGAPLVFTQKDEKGEDQQLICQAVMLVSLFPAN